MKCEICGKEILRDSQCINYKYYHNDCIENLQKENEKQKEVIDRIREYIEPLVTNKDDKECYPINFYVKDVLLSILKEVSK